MSRFVFGLLTILSLILSVVGWIGCGGGSSSTPLPTPTKVTIAPATGSGSLELGGTLQFTASVTNGFNQPITGVPVTYLSSNSSVLTFVSATAGLACAGRWDALGQVCSPGSIGTTQVTAVANGVTSPAVTVYVHDHVDTITISQFNPNSTPLPPTHCATAVPVACVSSAKVTGIQNFLDFQARAFSRGNDITDTIGSFTFQQVLGSVVTLNTTASELNNNNGQQVTQVRATAGNPGITQIFASAGGVNSAPVSFETCLVNSIQLQVGNASTNTTFAVPKGTGTTITPVVTDRGACQLTTNPPLTWASLAPANASVSTTGAVSTTAPGGTAIMSSCILPACNLGAAANGLPSLQAVYPSLPPPSSGAPYVPPVITGTITGPSGTGTVYVTSTCTFSGSVIPGCQPAILPITTSNNTVGNKVVLPSAPNSFQFSPSTANRKAYLGSSQGLMIFNPSASSTTNPITQLNSVPGKILAVSNNGNEVLVADTTGTPNQVFLVDTSATTPVVIPLLISGATAAAFSPDGFKSFIVSSSNGGATNTLFVYSAVEALQSVSLSGPANAVSFYANGGLAYLNGGAPNALSAYNTCDNSVAEASIAVPRLPAFFQVALDGVHAIGVDSPGLDVFSSTVTSPAAGSCAYSSTTTESFINLGQGPFTPVQLIVTPDSLKAYILANNLGSVFVYNFTVNTVEAIPLAGNPAPLVASLSSDGSQLYVGASDGQLHALSTLTNVDVAQIAFPVNNNSNNNAICTNIPQTCNPDLVAFAP